MGVSLAGIKQHGIINHPTSGRIFAYEVITAILPWTRRLVSLICVLIRPHGHFSLRHITRLLCMRVPCHDPNSRM